MKMRTVIRWRLRYIGIFLLSAATLMLQVAYTRIFSIALWNHFVWMIVSIALLGYAASGTLLSAYPRLLEMDLDRTLTTTSILCSASVLLSYWVSNRIPFDPSRLNWDSLQLVYITAYYLLLFIPFLFSGLALALTMERAGSRINRLYFSSFIGSSLGALFVLPLFGPLTGPGVIVFTSLVAGASALTFTYNRGKKDLAKIMVWMILLVILLPSVGGLIPVRLSPHKTLSMALRYPNASLIETRWNAFSRVDVVTSGLVRYAPGLSLHYEDPLPEQVGVIVDGDGLNAITDYDGNRSSLAFTGFLPAAFRWRVGRPHGSPS